MNCPQCQTPAVAEAVFCHHCGRALGDIAGDLSAKQRFAAALARGGDDGDPPEQLLWQGRFSPRAMFGAWAGAAVLSLAVVIGAAAAGADGAGWLAGLTLLAVVWLGLLGLMFYRQLNVHYYLTSQRVLHERGLLWREIDRIEAIDIDDVAFLQGPIERMFGVGKIRLRSSDVTTPEFEMLGIDDVRNVATMIDEVRRQERRRRGLHIEAI